MWSAVLVLTLATLAADSATVTTLDGRTARGELLAVSKTGVTLKTAVGEEVIPADKLLSIRAAAIPTRPAPKVLVQLADGSLLFGDELQLDASRVVLIGLEGGEVTLPRRAIRWVRWPGTGSAPALAWQEVLATKAGSDLLVVRKTSKDADDGPKIFLDPLEGVVSRVTASAVAFEFDGDPISVKAEKVEGVIFFKPAEPVKSTVVCVVNSTQWGTVQATEINLAGLEMEIKTPGNVSLKIPFTAGTVLDYRAGNRQWLAEIEPDEVRTNFHFQPAGMIVKFADLFSPRSQGPFGGDGLKLGKQTFESGLSLHSPTRMTYRIPEGFSRFQATLGLANEASTAAELNFRVLADQRVVYERKFTGAEAREPVEVECNLAAARRMSIEIDAGKGLDIGDTLILGDARFVK